jgi:outer membrane murein-binding lipoprotein Lpp
MPRACKFFGWVILVAGVVLAGCAKKQHRVFSSLTDAATVAQLKSFVAEKQAQANAATNEAAPGFAPFFAVAATGDWLAISNAFNDFRNHAGQYDHAGKTDERLRGPRWEAVKEVWGAFDAFGEGEEKYSVAFGRDIVASIPPGSIYFGGTDPGRFVVTAMCKSQVDADPFFVLTQNALADGSYLEYLRDIYGGKIFVPTAEDSQRCFADYTKEVAQRAEKHQLKPGEDFRKDENGRIQIAGQVAVMQINGLLVKTIFDKNPTQDFYIEESFPLDWMYPQLEPHGLIFKLDRQPLSKLSDDVVQNDHDYWAKYVQPMIGNWLNDDTSVAEVAAFAEKTFARHDFSGFKGDPRFIQNAYSHKMFSKLRSSSAGLYAWRASHDAGAEARERMAHEADFAFRQAWALCPYSPEAVYRYANFLMEQKRGGDALLVAETAAKMPEMRGADGAQLRSLAQQLKQYQKQK